MNAISTSASGLTAIISVDSAAERLSRAAPEHPAQAAPYASRASPPPGHFAFREWRHTSAAVPGATDQSPPAPPAFAECPAFSGTVAVQQIACFIPFLRTLPQTPQSTPLGDNRPYACPHDQRPAAQPPSATQSRVCRVDTPLHTLSHHAYAEERQPGRNHLTPQATFRT